MKEREPARVCWVSLNARQAGNGDEADKARGTLAPGLRGLPVEETSSGPRVSTVLLNKATRRWLS